MSELSKSTLQELEGLDVDTTQKLLDRLESIENALDEIAVNQREILERLYDVDLGYNEEYEEF